MTDGSRFVSELAHVASNTLPDEQPLVVPQITSPTTSPTTSVDVTAEMTDATSADGMILVRHGPAPAHAPDAIHRKRVRSSEEVARDLRNVIQLPQPSLCLLPCDVRTMLPILRTCRTENALIHKAPQGTSHPYSKLRVCEVVQHIMNEDKRLNRGMQSTSVLTRQVTQTMARLYICMLSKRAASKPLLDHLHFQWHYSADTPVWDLSCRGVGFALCSDSIPMMNACSLELESAILVLTSSFNVPSSGPSSSSSTPVRARVRQRSILNKPA
jgi:hypothetical protein